MDTVIFRRWRHEGKEVIALFPYDQVGDYWCNSYEHVGQHGGADYNLVIRYTKPADINDEDVQALMKELTEIGYDLTIRKRRNWKAMRHKVREDRESD